MKVYRGKTNTDGDAEVTVEQDGNTAKLEHIVVHSPTGFAWGYLGSGPADLSLSLLTDFLGNQPTRSLYMKFKERVIARLSNGPWVMTEEDIMKAMKDEIAEYNHKHVHGNRNIGRDPKTTDTFYCGPTEKINSEEHAIELGIYKAYDQGYEDYVVVDGKPTACMRLSPADSHEGHLWQYGSKGILTCECGKDLGKY